MSSIEVYNPMFSDFHGRPMITWRGKHGPVRTDENLFEQYRRWKNTKLPKDDLPPAFWQSGGPAIVRALEFCGAKALIFEYVGDRRVAYQWFARQRTTHSGDEWYRVCSVSIAGHTTIGVDMRVEVVLPSDENVVFWFAWSQLQDWWKPELLPKETAEQPEPQPAESEEPK
jgi:hypothetical protein